MGVLDVDAEQIGHQPADERELLVALAQDRFDALAHALAVGFEIGEQFLP